MPLRALDDAARDLAVRAFRHAHAAQGIAAMSVETGGEEDRVRLVVVDDADDVVFDRAQIRGVAGAAVERNVLREAASLADADLVRGAGARIKRIAMRRRVIDVVALFEE